MFAGRGLELHRVCLERGDVAAVSADGGPEPDRRVAAGAADLEHLAAGPAGAEGVEERPARRLDLERALLDREVGVRLARPVSSSSRRRTARTRSSSISPSAPARRRHGRSSGEMVVHDAACLHGGVHRRRPNEAEARLAQALGERGRLGASAPASPRGAAGRGAPRARGPRRARPAARPTRAARPWPARSRSPPRSCRGGGRCRRPRAAARRRPRRSARPASGSKPANARAERRPLAQDRQPREPRLEPLEAEPLVDPALVADRPAPFLVVVAEVLGVGRLPAANRLGHLSRRSRR